MTTDIDLDAIAARADAATEGPWFYDSYSGVFSAPKVALHDPWLDTVDANHSMERHGRCGACGQDGCRLFSEEYRRNPLVAHVPAHHGDSAIGMHAADAEFIAHARTDVPQMAAEIRHLRAEWHRLVNDRVALLAVVRAAEAWADAHEDSDVRLIRRRSATPVVGDLYDAVEQYRLMSPAPAPASDDQPYEAPR